MENIYKYSNERLTEEVEKPNTKEESKKKLNSSKFIKQLPINYKSPNTLKITGWNWRSLTMSKSYT